MKLIIILTVMFLSLQAFSQQDYTLQINDSIINVGLDKNYNIRVNGQNLNIIIKQNDTLLYNEKSFSFKHLKDVKVSKKNIGDGIEQISILTAEGSGIIIQSYTSLNPMTLTGFMMNEITKESISYGYVSTKTNYKKRLASGKEIDITKEILRYKDDVNIYEIAAAGKKDTGIILITIRMDEEENSEGQNLIDLMWKTLQLKF